MNNINRNAVNPEYLRSIYTGRGRIGTELGQAGLESGIRLRNYRDTMNISEEARRMQRTSQALNVERSAVDQQKEINRPGQQETVLRDKVNLEKQGDQPDREEGARLKQNEDFQKWLESRKQLYEGRGEPARVEVPTVSEPREPAESEPGISEERDNPPLQAGYDNYRYSDQVQAYASAANFTQAALTVNYKL